MLVLSKNDKPTRWRKNINRDSNHSEDHANLLWILLLFKINKIVPFLFDMTK